MNRKQRRTTEKLNRMSLQVASAPQRLHDPVPQHLDADSGDASRGAQGLHDLGITALQSHKPDVAVELFRRSLAARANSPETLVNLAVALKELGQLDEAHEACRKAIALRPGSAGAHNTLGHILKLKNDPEGALHAFRNAIQRDPRLAVAYVSMADILAIHGKLDQALSQCERALALAPGLAVAHKIHGQILYRQKRHADAIAAYRLALTHSPGQAELHTEIGLNLRALGRHADAIAAHEQAIALDPACAPAFLNLAVTLQDIGRLQDALDAYKKGLDLDPDSAEGYANLGGLLRTMTKYDGAVSALSHAISLNPDMAEAHYNLGSVHRATGQHDEAQAALQKALACDPNMVMARVDLLHLRRHICDWSNLTADENDCLETIRQTQSKVSPFSMLPMPSSRADQLLHGRIFAAAAARRVSRPLNAHLAPARGIDGRRLRIGYVSGDFHEHATGMLMAELLERHDKRQFELFAYCFSAHDGSELRKRILAAFDNVTDIRALSHEETARRIHADGIDILVDLKGYTRDSRSEIFAHRPAPVQVNYLGYPGTLGAEFVDYLIADSMVAPSAHQTEYSEKIVHLPGSYQPNDTRRKIADATPTRIVCGLPDDAFVFCSFNNTYKITAEVFDVWARLLNAVPDSILWLLDTGDHAKRNLHREAADRGLDPRRLVFAPRLPADRHLARHRVADLFLDCLPVNAHTTASDALWAGLPVLTCVGETFAGRVAASLLHAIGLPELVTRNLPDYESLALDLARSPERLKSLRDRLAANRLTAPLYDIAAYTRNIERAYRHMARLHAQGTPPQAFAVADLPAEDAHVMLARLEASMERVAYANCPLCDGTNIPPQIEADASKHANGNPALPPKMTWHLCMGCGHVFTGGYLTPEMLGALRAETPPHRKTGHDAEAQRKISARIVERIARHAAEGEWLDVETGNGSLLFTADEWGFKASGTDYCEHNIRTLQTLGYEAHHASIDQLPGDSHYAVISMAGVLQAMPFPRVAIASAHRLLKPGGVLFLSMPNMASIVWRAMDATNANPYWTEIAHMHNFTRSGLYRLLKRHGFTPVEYSISDTIRSGMDVIALKV